MCSPCVRPRLAVARVHHLDHASSLISPGLRASMLSLLASDLRSLGVQVPLFQTHPPRDQGPPLLAPRFGRTGSRSPFCRIVVGWPSRSTPSRVRKSAGARASLSLEADLPRATITRRICALVSVTPWSSRARFHDVHARFPVARSSSFTCPSAAILRTRCCGTERAGLARDAEQSAE